MVFRPQNGRGKAERRGGGRRGVRRRVVGDAGSRSLLGNRCCRPAPSGLSVPLTVGGAGSAAQGDMPVRFKVRPGARRRVAGTPRGGCATRLCGTEPPGRSLCGAEDAPARDLARRCGRGEFDGEPDGESVWGRRERRRKEGPRQWDGRLLCVRDTCGPSDAGIQLLACRTLKRAGL